MGWSRELQISLFGGNEFYQNAGSSNFSRQYDLWKFGTSLEFPLSNRWTTGGEVVYGIGGDKSTKEEISGHFNYFINRNWSSGAGYRLHLFNAGSTASSPGYLPYREGYTELYTSLFYYY